MNRKAFESKVIEMVRSACKRAEIEFAKIPLVHFKKCGSTVQRIVEIPRKIARALSLQKRRFTGSPAFILRCLQTVLLVALD